MQDVGTANCGKWTVKLAAVVALPDAVTPLSVRLGELGWVPDLWIAGSLATGDYIPGVSDLDLVATVDGQVDPSRQAVLTSIHRDLDRGQAAGADLGCVYVDVHTLSDSAAVHPTWTHGSLVQRTLSGVTRAELVRYGVAVYGRAPTVLLPPASDDDVRAAARAEVCGYWAWASRRPLMWLSPVIADLGLTSMARGRGALDTGQLMTKSQAIERAHAPQWLIDQLLARRHGRNVVSPRVRTGWIAWRDTRRTVRAARRRGVADVDKA